MHAIWIFFSHVHSWDFIILRYSWELYYVSILLNSDIMGRYVFILISFSASPYGSSLLLLASHYISSSRSVGMPSRASHSSCGVEHRAPPGESSHSSSGRVELTLALDARAWEAPTPAWEAHHLWWSTLPHFRFIFEPMGLVRISLFFISALIISSAACITDLKDIISGKA